MNFLQHLIYIIREKLVKIKVFPIIKFLKIRRFSLEAYVFLEVQMIVSLKYILKKRIFVLVAESVIIENRWFDKTEPKWSKKHRLI